MDRFSSYEGLHAAEVAIQAFLPSICCLHKAGEKSFRIIPHSSSSPCLAPTPPFVLMLYAYFRAILHSQVRFYNDHPLPSLFFHKRKMFIPLFSYILTPLLLELSLQTKKIRHGKRIGGELLDGEGQQVMASKIRGVFILVLKS